MPSIRRPGMLPIYVLRWPRISASSLTPPNERRMKRLPNAPAIDDANDVLPTPGGPTKHSTGPLASGLSCPQQAPIPDPIRLSEHDSKVVLISDHY